MFKKLAINEAILRVLSELKFDKPSEIQDKAIPLVMQGKDVIGGSATGSGKTLVFAAGILDRIEPGKGVQVLILEPTRELAEQVKKAVRQFYKYTNIKVGSIYGGVAIEPQIKELERAEVVIGTPGRVMDHLKRDTLQPDNLKVFVLDEADRMLDMGFIDDVEDIIKQMPKKRQTLLFSATIDADISHLAKRYTKDAVEVSAEQYVDPSKLTQFFYEVEPHLKFSLLVHLLHEEKSKLVLVFCNTRRNADFVSKNLKFSGIDAIAIHGGFSQNKRTRAMDQFTSENKTFVLVCTDIAARGLDIKGISHVYNYDIPKDSKDYIHRVGRTARAGKEGKAISLLTQRDFENFRKVLKNPDLDLKQEQVPQINRVPIKWFDEDEKRSFGNRFRGPRGRGNFGGRDTRREGGRGFRSRDDRGHRGDNREHREYGGRENRDNNRDSKRGAPKHTGYRRSY